MNLKDRLENIRTSNILSIKDDYQQDNFFDVEEIFADSKEIRTVISETINAGKNMVFISEPSIDKMLIAKYFKFLMAYKSEDVVISNNLTDEILSSESRVNILPLPSMQDVVKILEYIMYGYKSFVFGMNFVGSENTINKLTTSIAINNKNMSQESIETLLSSSNLVFVYFDKNIDGLFYISKIDKLVSENLSNEIVTIIDLHVEKANQKKRKISKKSSVEKEIVEEPKKSNVEEPLTNDNVDVQTVNDSKTVEETENIEENSEERVKKINKYKKLKEKFKNKKANQSE